MGDECCGVVHTCVVDSRLLIDLSNDAVLINVLVHHGRLAGYVVAGCFAARATLAAYMVTTVPTGLGTDGSLLTNLGACLLLNARFTSLCSDDVLIRLCAWLTAGRDLATWLNERALTLALVVVVVTHCLLYDALLRESYVIARSAGSPSQQVAVSRAPSLLVDLRACCLN